MIFDREFIRTRFEQDIYKTVFIYLIVYIHFYKLYFVYSFLK